MKTLPPEVVAFNKLDPQVKAVIQAEIAKDRDLQKLYKKKADAKAAGRKTDKLEEQIQDRINFFIMIQMRRFAKMTLSVHKGFELMKTEEEQETYIWRMCLSFFLADFLQDVYTDMENMVRQYYPEEHFPQLEDFFQLNKKVQAYMTSALGDECQTYTKGFFEEYSSSIKMTIYNKAKGFTNALLAQIEEEDKQEAFNRRQLSFDFKD